MNSYEYRVSLRITHPTISPELITQTLNIEPFRKWTVGEPRSNPKGQSLPGINKESFWGANLHKPKNLNSENIVLEEFLVAANKRLSSHAEFFAQLVREGGYVEYFVGWLGSSNFGATFEPSLMEGTAKLNIAIGLDIYPDESSNETAA
ncbi:MAG: hypothetical protein ACYCZQ_08825 [Burkholderiales bacterium]